MRASRFFVGLILLLLPAAAIGQPDIPVVHYKAVPEWPKPPLGDKGFAAGPWNYWQVPGIAIKRDGNILVLHRGEFPILEYKPNGDFVAPWGDVKFDQGKVMYVAKADRTADISGYQAVYGPPGCNNCGAHEIRVDSQGNVWAIDAPAHVITKMNPQGRTIMTLGTRGKRGMTENTFYMPTDIAFAPNGELVVTDGYGSARVVRFSTDGKYLGQFGSRGNGPGQFQLPHNLVIDAKGQIYISDRDNQRIEIFDPKGTYLREWRDVGAISSLVMTRDQKIWTGGVLRDLDGKALERLPGEGANARGHGAAVADNGDIYLGLLAGTVAKFVRQ
jgi:DNA-binding beta-propeller fold protein YncE